MSSHNHAKNLEILESLLYETLSKKQQDELAMLKHMKKKIDDHEESVRKQVGTFATYYDKEGKGMSFWEWSGYRSDRKYNIINQNAYGDFFVSTVWLGMDLGFPNKPAAPVIFETMIFVEGDREHELQGYQERYCTEEAAIKGHIDASRLASSASMKDLNARMEYLTKRMKKSLKKDKEK